MMRQAAHGKSSQSPSLLPPKLRSPASILCDLATQVSVATALLPTTLSLLPRGHNPTRYDLFKTSLQAVYLSLHWGSSNPIPRSPRTFPPSAHLLFPLGDSGLPGQELSCTYPPAVCTPGRHHVFIYLLHHYLSPMQNESFLRAGTHYIPDARAWHAVGS